MFGTHWHALPRDSGLITQGGKPRPVSLSSMVYKMCCDDFCQHCCPWWWVQSVITGRSWNVSWDICLCFLLKSKRSLASGRQHRTQRGGWDWDLDFPAFTIVGLCLLTFYAIIPVHFPKNPDLCLPGWKAMNWGCSPLCGVISQRI